MSPTATARRGRPRDEALDVAILTATIEELRERGFAGLSMEAVAARAGVAKTTVYRRWSNSDELALDALRSYLGDDEHEPEGTGRERVLALLHRMRRKWNDPTYAAVMRRVAADGSARPTIYRQFRARLIAPGIEQLNAALARSIDEGELRADTDIELARRMIVSPVIAASMTLRGATTKAEAEAVVATVYAGLAPDWQDRAMATLVLLRHGESDWNQKNLFTGWVDVDLTAKGEAEGVRGGELLVEHDLLPDVVHTSLLRRAIRTGQLALDRADRHWIPVRRSWRLNERHYGALQGKDKAQVRDEFGDEQFMLWRRSYDTPPPPLDDADEFSQAGDPRYADLLETLPRTECLQDVVTRMLPYWFDAIVPDLRTHGVVLVAAHGNSLRALIKYLDGMSDEDVVGLNVPTGIPLHYDLDAATLRPTGPGTYLDPDAAEDAIAAVANQGKN